MTDERKEEIWISIKKYSIALLLIMLFPFMCNEQKVYQLRKTDDGYRLTIQGYEDEFEPCYCPPWIYFSSLDDMRMRFINKSFTLKELYHIERGFLEDDNGDKIIVDLDNLYQPTMNDKPLTVTGITYTPTGLKFSIDWGDELGCDELYGTVRYAINVKEESEIRDLIAAKLHFSLEDELQAEKTYIEIADKKYELYQYVAYNTPEKTWIKYSLFLYDEQAVFIFDFSSYDAAAEQPDIEFFKSFSFEKYEAAV